MIVSNFFPASSRKRVGQLELTGDRRPRVRDLRHHRAVLVLDGLVDGDGRQLLLPPVVDEVVRGDLEQPGAELVGVWVLMVTSRWLVLN